MLRRAMSSALWFCAGLVTGLGIDLRDHAIDFDRLSRRSPTLGAREVKDAGRMAETSSSRNESGRQAYSSHTSITTNLLDIRAVVVFGMATDVSASLRGCWPATTALRMYFKGNIKNISSQCRVEQELLCNKGA